MRITRYCSLLLLALAGFMFDPNPLNAQAVTTICGKVTGMEYSHGPITSGYAQWFHPYEGWSPHITVTDSFGDETRIRIYGDHPMEFGDFEIAGVAYGTQDDVQVTLADSGDGEPTLHDIVLKRRGFCSRIPAAPPFKFPLTK